MKYIVLFYFFIQLYFTKTTMKDYIQDLKSVDHNKIYVKNRDEVNKKIAKFIAEGFKNLSVISDYDKTITKQHVDGKTQLHAFDLFKRCPSVPAEVKQLLTEISQKYAPLDKDLTISENERNKLMSDWWMQTIAAYRGLKITVEEMTSTSLKYGPPPRDNATEFFEILSKADVPVLLLSGGIGELLEPLLKQMNVSINNIEMLVNRIKFDDEGKIIGYQAPPIHTINKNTFSFNGTNFLKNVKNRRNILIMGDHLGDAVMAEKVENVENVLKIGFYYGEAESVLPTWLNTFDIVLKDDQSMNVPIAILNLLK